jgi:hypothetical protein
MERFRQYVVVTLTTLGASVFWGALLGGLVRYFFNISQDEAFLVCCVTAAVVVVLMFPKMWKPFGYDRPNWRK